MPLQVLEEFAELDGVPEDSRAALVETIALEPAWRQLRRTQTEVARKIRAQSAAIAGLAADLAPRPAISIFDCKTTKSLPGAPISDPTSSPDATVVRAYEEAQAVADFYRDCFNRNSIDDRGMTIVSSVHYGVGYTNAFWQFQQMTYGDGDGNAFIDFTLSSDVIGHELTHGVTQFSAGFALTGEAGTLNESMSDVFGSMFRQWRKNQTADQADWLIAADVVGPGAKQRGYTCLRDLSDPGAGHCMTRQPDHVNGYVEGDPHKNSGIPNHAFYLAATAIGGHAWEKAGKVWYAALTHRKATKNMRMAAFAALTRDRARALYPDDTEIYDAVDGAWNSVGLP